MEHAREALREGGAGGARDRGERGARGSRAAASPRYHLEYGITGSNLETLEQKSEAIVARDARPTRTSSTRARATSSGKPELQIQVDRKRAADLGVPVRALADTVRALVGGVDVATFQDEGHRYDVRVRLEEAQRDDLAELGQIQVARRGGALVDLANVAKLEIGERPGADRARLARTARHDLRQHPEGVALGSATDRLDQIVAGVGLPPGYAARTHGQAERMKDSANSVSSRFLLALVALYMILASQFNSFTQPAVIMLTAPLSFVGAFAALRLSGLVAQHLRADRPRRV